MDSNYKRMDTCKRCGYVVFVYDKIGYDITWYRINSMSETRKVLIEKTETNGQILLRKLKEDSIRRKIMGGFSSYKNNGIKRITR